MASLLITGSERPFPAFMTVAAWLSTCEYHVLVLQTMVSQSPIQMEVTADYLLLARQSIFFIVNFVCFERLVMG